MWRETLHITLRKLVFIPLTFLFIHKQLDKDSFHPNTFHFTIY